jgi:polyisoprenoid-binding protein YceI
MKNLFGTAAIVLGTLVSTGAAAETWTLDADQSIVAFGSVKKDTVGEAHSFQKLSGSVAADGTAEVEIDLTSVQTNVDVRNERIGEHVFGGAATALLKASIDMDEMAGLGVGDSLVTEIDGDLAFLGQEIPVYLDVFVMRTTEDQVLVTTNSMLYVSTEEAGIDAGLDTLMQLADLPGITRTFPVTFRMMFDADK